MFEVATLFAALVALSRPPAAAPLPRAYMEGDRSESWRMLGGNVVSSYDIPYICSVHYTDDRFPIGTCSIITSTIVLTSMETMDWSHTESADELVKRRKIKPGFDPVIYEHFTKAQLNLRHIGDITIIAGKDLLRITRFMQSESKTYQESRVKHYFAVDTSGADPQPVYDYDPPNLQLKEDFPNNTQQDYDFFTFKFNFMFLELSNYFKWSTGVLPVPLLREYADDWRKLRDEMKQFQHEMNSMDINDFADTFSQGMFCTVGGWALRNDQPLTFKEVSLVTKSFCESCYCNYEPSSCLEFPPDIDLCYTSTSYGDVCDFDQGSALFCNYFNDSVIGFVKKSIACGIKGVPVLYTPMFVVLQAFFQHFHRLHWEDRPNWKNYELEDPTTAPGPAPPT